MQTEIALNKNKDGIEEYNKYAGAIACFSP